MTFSERVYRVLLKAYPPGFRREYQGPMSQHFRDQLSLATSAGKLLRFWVRIIADLFRTVPLRHLERWLPQHGNSRFSDEARKAIFLHVGKQVRLRDPRSPWSICCLEFFGKIEG
jgi:hypothetical protein